MVYNDFVTVTLKDGWMGHPRGEDLYLSPYFANSLVSRGVAVMKVENESNIKRKRGRPIGKKQKKTYNNKVLTNYKNKSM